MSTYLVKARYLGHSATWHSCSRSDWRNGCTGPHPNLKRVVSWRSDNIVNEHNPDLTSALGGMMKDLE